MRDARSRFCVAGVTLRGSTQLRIGGSIGIQRDQSKAYLSLLTTIADIRARGIFQYQHFSTHDQLADAFTKPLPRDAFTKFRCWMGMG